MPIKIDHEKCCWKDGKCTECSCEGECTGCAEICPVNALVRKEKLEINHEACIDCGSCIAVCKYQALSFG